MPNLNLLLRKVKPKVGKRVGDSLYVHWAYIKDLPVEYRAQVREALALVEAARESRPWDVAKLRIGYYRDRVSFIKYNDFNNNPHPEISYSTSVNIDQGTTNVNTYSGSIIHRKELMVGSNHPGRHAWEELTKSEERAGLYDKPHLAHIGRKRYWNSLLVEKGLEIRPAGDYYELVSVQENE